MARLLAIVDRQPDDPEWKGAAAWKLILSLAESQHEVRVLTTLPTESLSIAHPRLTITRPVHSWNVNELPRLVQAVWQFQPEVIHSFALKPNLLWSRFTCWPWLTSLGQNFPQLKRWSTLFDESDLNPKDASFSWHLGASGLTVPHLHLRQKVREHFSSVVEILPLDLEGSSNQPLPQMGEFILVTAPVSAWPDPQLGLSRLAAYLEQNPQLQVVINGGWGSLPATVRKVGWRKLATVMGRVQMIEPLHFSDLLSHAERCTGLWLDPLQSSSWSATVGFELGRRLGKRVFAGAENIPPLPETSPANFLSRLYVQS